MNSKNSHAEKEFDSNDIVKVVTKWSCDFCERKVFDTFKEAEEHEKICEFNPACKESSVPHTIIIPSPTNLKDPMFCVTVWTCDVCRVAEFSSYEEALEHEKNCKGVPPDKSIENSSRPTVEPSEGKSKLDTHPQSQKEPSTMTKNTSNEKVSDNTHVHEEKKMCTVIPTHSNLPQNKEQMLISLSPLIGSADDTAHYYSISSYDLIISQSIDLYEYETNIDYVGARAIGCRCHYCSFTWQGELTMNRFESIWRKEIPNHLQICKCISKLTKGKLDNLQPLAGKTNLKTFITSFFEDNGIQERMSQKSPITSESKPYLCFLPCTLWKRRDYNYNNRILSTRRKRWMNEILECPISHDKLDRKNAPQTRFLDIGSENNKPTHPSSLKIIPTNELPQYAQLSSFLRLGLEQMRFYIDDRSRVCIACNHCESMNPIYDVVNLHKKIYSMLYSHISKTCNNIPDATRSLLKIFQTEKSNKTLGLRLYCEFMINHFKLKELVSSEGYTIGFTLDTELLKTNENSKKRKSGHLEEDIRQHSKSNASKKECVSSTQPKKIVIPTSRFYSMKLSANSAPTFLPPQGGIPLICSITSSKAAKLNDNSHLLLDQLELCEVMKSQELFDVRRNPTTSLPLAVRCQNCKSQPNFSHSVYIPTKKDLSKIVLDFHDHIKSCEFTDSSVRKILANNKDVKKSLPQISSYCNFISSFYGIEEEEDPGGWIFESFVKWGKTEPFAYQLNNNNKSNERKHYKALQTSQIMPTLCMSPANSNNQNTSTPLNGSKEWSKKMVLSDYNFIILCQIDLVPVARKIAASTSIRTSLRQRIKQSDQERKNITQSSSGSVPPPFSESPYTIGLRCKHCLTTRGVSSIQQCVSNNTYNFFNHFKKCPSIPRKVAAKIEEVKAYQSLQRSTDGVASLTEYIRKIILDVYKMEDLEWNGVTGGVVLGDDAVNVIRKYNKNKKDLSNKPNDDQEHSFALPFVIPEQVEPVTCSYIDFAS